MSPHDDERGESARSRGDGTVGGDGGGTDRGGREAVEDTAEGDGGPVTSADEAFASVGDELRFAILDELHDHMGASDRSEHTVPYSELRQAVGDPDSGRFSYHLDQLVGEFIEKRPGGYAIRYPGRELVRTVRSGVVSGPVVRGRAPVEETCYLCGEPVEVVYDGEYVSACCTSCSGAFAFDLPPPRAVSFLPVPSGAVADGVSADPEGLLDRVHARFCHAARTYGDDSCYRCSGPMQLRLETCHDHASEGPCSTCGTVFDAVFDVTCTVCDQHGLVPPAHAVSHRGPFRESLAAAGVDRLGYRAFAEAAAWPHTAAERDGEPVAVYDLPTESAPVVVDAETNIWIED